MDGTTEWYVVLEPETCSPPHHLGPGRLDREVEGCRRLGEGVAMGHPTELGPVPLPDGLVEWQKLDRTVERHLMEREIKGHLHKPAVTHLNFSHSRMRAGGQISPYFWEIHDSL